MRRGEVWWALLPDPAGRRPVLLLSRDSAYVVRTSVTVALISTTIRNIPVEVRVGPAHGLPRECVINLDEVNTIRKSLLDARVCVLDGETLRRAEKALHFALDLKF
ncbi:MAG: type II toxin-antitoxin system PemK/MazF family toxin [Candidatus Xenobia bacterium]